MTSHWEGISRAEAQRIIGPHSVRSVAAPQLSRPSLRLCARKNNLEGSEDGHVVEEIGEARRGVAGRRRALPRRLRGGRNNGIYIPGWLRRDEEEGRLLLPYGLQRK